VTEAPNTPEMDTEEVEKLQHQIMPALEAAFGPTAVIVLIVGQPHAGGTQTDTITNLGAEDAAEIMEACAVKMRAEHSS